eukprot:318494_1
MTALGKMNQDQLIAWIDSLPTDASFSDSVKKACIAGIKKYAQEKGSAVTGIDFYEAEDGGDLKDMMVGVDKKFANSLFSKVEDKMEEDVQRALAAKGSANNQSSSKTEVFTVNIQGPGGKMYKIKNCTKLTKVSTVKADFLSEFGNEAAADQYRGNVAKWNKNDGKHQIELKKRGQNMSDGRTLESYGMTNASEAIMPLIVSFKVSGGAYYESKEESKDKRRNRKLRTKKHRGYLKLSSAPDCIMGYTNADRIKRAEMPCGCAFAADTMYRYLKSIFEKNFKETKAICPMPPKQCKGSEKQRIWPWALVFIVADLTQKEVVKYTKAIENRLSGSKNCPHCDATTERPDDLRISRVRCNVCNKSDWCWNCLKVWKSGGLGPICGNPNCMAAEINSVLKNCGTIKAPSNWEITNKEQQIPTTRACPKCLSPLEYTQACKHIWCICCPHQFCFNCLGNWKSGSEFQSNECGHNKICGFTKVQEFK